MSWDEMSRRGVFVRGGAAAAALTMASSPLGAMLQAGAAGAIGRPMPGRVDLPSTPPKPKRADSMGFAIIGLGGYALNQMMPRFPQAERAHVAAIVSGNAEKRKLVGDAYGVPEDARYSYEDFGRIASDKRVEAVYIVLPTGLHADWAERSFAAGKHVLCEKPMALSSAECARMIAASRRANRKLMIAYRCHFEPHNLAAIELMERKAVGDIRLIRCNQEYRMGPTNPADNWRVDRELTGGGPLEDYGIYGLQAALYLSREMPESISATAFRPAGDPRFTEIFAHVGSQLRFPSGVVAQLSTSYDSQGGNIVQVNGTNGTLLMDPATAYGGHKMVLDANGRQELKPGDPEVQFAGQLDNFVDAVRDGATIKTPGEMGLRDVRLIEAIYASAATGRTVKLNPDATMQG